MPATVKTKEIFPGSTNTNRLDKEVILRIKAGAIKCSYRKVSGKYNLITEWNVIGEQ